MTIKVFYVPSTHVVEMPEKPKRIWTALPTCKEPEIPDKLIHHENAFLESEIHDYSWKDGTLRYFSRCVERDEFTWIFAEF